MTPLQSLLAGLLLAEDRDQLIGYGEVFLTYQRFLKSNRDAQRAREKAIYLINGEPYNIDGVLDYAIAKPSDVISLTVKHEHFTLTEIHKADEQTTYMLFIASQKPSQVMLDQMLGTRLSECVGGMDDFKPLTDKLIITEAKTQDVTLFEGNKDCHLTIYCNHADIPGARELPRAA